jgi:hypothetical protein
MVCILSGDEEIRKKQTPLLEELFYTISFFLNQNR